MRQYHTNPEDDLRRFLASFPEGTYVAVAYRGGRAIVTYVGIVLGAEAGRIRFRHAGSGDEQLLLPAAIVDVRAVPDDE